MHPKPYPEMPHAKFSLPDTISSVEGLLEAHEGIFRAVSSGDLAVTVARDLSALVEAQRRILETTVLELRLSKLEGETKS